jgi:hypothetical protein
MPSQYRSAPKRPRQSRAWDDYWYEQPVTMNVIVEDDNSVDTGLVDEFGVTIWRVPARERLGF